MRTNVLAIGTYVFLVGLGLAFWAGYQAHNMTNENRVLDREFDAYQGLTVIGLMITSVGIGILTYGLEFENHENDARKIPKSALVIGAVISAFSFGTALWAGLATQHMEILRIDHPGKYRALQLWAIVGFWVGSLAMVITAYGLSSNPRHHFRKRQRTSPRKRA